MPAVEQPAWLPLVASTLPSRGSLLMLRPELVPRGSEVLSLTMKPNNLSPLHKRKRPASLGILPR